MILFNVYTYQFNPIIGSDQYHLFVDIREEKKKIMKNKNQALKSLLDQQQLTYRTKKLNYNCVYFDDDLFIFQVANQKYISLEKNFKKIITETNPSIYVIIYNDPAVQRILIENKPDTFASTDVISSVLATSFNKYLHSYSLEVSIKKEYSQYEFWDFVANHPEGIKMIRFEFDYPNLPRVSEYISQSIKRISEETLSSKTKFELNSEESSLNVSIDNPEIDNLVKASSNSGNPITFKAKGMRKHIKTGNRIRTIKIEEVEISAMSIQELKETIKIINE